MVLWNILACSKVSARKGLFGVTLATPASAPVGLAAARMALVMAMR